MDKTPCLHCGRVGLVRCEVVIKGRDAALTFDCGYCENTWQETDRRQAERNNDGRSDGATGSKANADSRIRSSRRI
jgi:transcription elongation factor Elf1